MHGRGFTLMEVLVVLVITGLLAGLLFTSLDALATGESRLGARASREGATALALAWWTDSAESVVADTNVPFDGSPTGFSALAIDTPAESSRQRRLRWRVDGPFEDTLVLEGEGLAPMPLVPGGTGLRFAYLDAEGRSHDRWPPPLGQFPVLPERIVLLATQPAPSVRAIARVAGPKDPPRQALSREFE